MKNGLYKSIFILGIITVLSSCNRVPVEPPEPVIDHIKIRDLRAMFEGGVTTIDTNIYIQGIITLTPELNNVPSMIAYIQDSTASLCLKVDGDNTFARDSEVKIYCRGLSLADYSGLIQFGDVNIQDHTELINLTATPPAPQTVTIAELLAGEHQAEYVMIENVQFKDAGTFSGTKILTDCSAEIEVYTRSSATFSGVTMPAGNGAFKGIASVYTDKQLLLREDTELAMTGERCGSSSQIYLSEDFATLAKNANVSTLAGWKTYPEAGTKTWYGNYVVSSNRWVQATAYQSGEASVITWMITPALDLTDATEPFVSFESANGYDKGATIELFVSVDYNGSATPWTSTWTELSFTLPPLNASGWSLFVSSGQVDLTPYIGGNAYIAWVYKGGGTMTTTWEIDNVLAAEK